MSASLSQCVALRHPVLAARAYSLHRRAVSTSDAARKKNGCPRKGAATGDKTIGLIRLAARRALTSCCVEWSSRNELHLDPAIPAASDIRFRAFFTIFADPAKRII